MAEFYNAETLLEFVKQNTPHINGETTLQCVERAIKEAPTADVVEVKYGKWEKRKTIIFDSVKVGYNCSECNTTWDTGTPYCPNCGAKNEW